MNVDMVSKAGAECMGVSHFRGRRGMVSCSVVCRTIVERVLRRARPRLGRHEAAVLLSLRGVQRAAYAAASVHRFARVFVRSYVHLHRALNVTRERRCIMFGPHELYANVLVQLA